MNTKKWQNLYREIERALQGHRMVDSYLNRKATVIKPRSSTVAFTSHNQKHCIACGQPIDNILWMGRHRFCEQCLGTYNTLEDYCTAFQSIALWMENFYTLIGNYPISVISNSLPYTTGRAIRVKKKNMFTPAGILCKGFMRKDAIEINMIYVYVELWLYEELKEQNRRNVLFQKYGDKGIKEIPYWYVALYLDWHGKREQVEIMIKNKELFQGKLRYTFLNTDTYDIRIELTRTLKCHPLYR